MRLVTVVVPALQGLRRQPLTVLLLASAAAMGAGVAGALLLLRRGLGLPARFHAEWELAWSPLVQTPDETITLALAQLGSLLLALALSVAAIAVVSLAALATARSNARRDEIHVRRAIGASRLHLVAAGSVEGLLLLGAAMAAGAIAGLAGSQLLAARWPGAVARVIDSPLAVTVIALALVVWFGALLPAWHGREARRVSFRPGHDLGLILPALQLGASGVLVATLGQLSGRPAELHSPPSTVRGGIIQTIDDSAASSAVRAHRADTLLRALALDPGVALVSLSSPGAVVGMGVVDHATADCGRCFVGGIYMRFRDVRVVHHLVSADTFDTIALRLVEGRRIQGGDAWSNEPVAVVSRTLAARWFENGQAVGRRIALGTDWAWHTVVGVVEDRAPPAFGGNLQPREAVYLSILQHPPAVADLLITGPAAAAPTATVRSAEVEWSRARAPALWTRTALRVAAVAGILLALVGSWEVMRLWADGARAELALHRALGARRRHLLWRLGKRVTAITAVGLVVAWALGPVMSLPLRWMVAGLPSWDAELIGMPLALLVGVTILGLAGPVREVLRSPPARHLD